MCLSLFNEIRPHGGVVTQRIANPCTPVRFRVWPPISSPSTKSKSQRLRDFKGVMKQHCQDIWFFLHFPSWQIIKSFVKGSLQDIPMKKREQIVHLAVHRKTCSPVAQLVEQTAVNRSVAGSSPAWGATSLSNLKVRNR